jgi:hypothetical protein
VAHRTGPVHLVTQRSSKPFGRSRKSSITAVKQLGAQWKAPWPAFGNYVSALKISFPRSAAITQRMTTKRSLGQPSRRKPSVVRIRAVTRGARTPQDSGDVRNALGSMLAEWRDGRARASFRTCRYCAARPSIWCWRDHAAGKSPRRATPMACGSRPSMAALTRSGARKASEIVIFTLRTLHLSRLAMLSVVVVSSAISSSSQRRPRAIDATKVARFSERIGRTCCGDIPSGTRIARRRLDIVFCQAT